MSLIDLLIFVIISIPVEYFVIKFEIKSNINLFYDLHRKQIERELKNFKDKDDD